MIELRELTIGFSGRTVLDKIDLTIREGEITIIIGRSGCGKSVLMKSIEGLVKPVAGTILIDGVEITQLPEKELYRIRKKMAMLFQGSALLDSLNVYQNVALPLFEHTGGSAEEIRKVVTDNLELVGLPDILDRMPVELSGGMKKRVALARAMVMKPKYIIFDEPTTGLDPVIAAGINALIL
ncbi:MAG: ATP-binding cassette domain-containing protein, partial [Candidatus Cloacimonetes bacterium]|nr:ATP-binding cassette domain-containing protein [Candidatus Cloacimonadota bacterium]